MAGVVRDTFPRRTPRHLKNICWRGPIDDLIPRAMMGECKHDRRTPIKTVVNEP